MQHRKTISTLVPFLGRSREQSSAPISDAAGDAVAAHPEAATGERQELDLGLIFDAIPEGVVAIDDGGIVLFANSEAARQSGIAQSNLVGCDVRTLFGRIDEAMLRQGARADLDADLIRSDGSTLPVHLTLAARTRNDIGASRPIIFRAHDVHQADDRTREEFVSILSHELRAPLSAILGSLNVIEGGAVGNVGPQMAPMIEMAQRNARRMLALIDDTLEAERIGAGNIEVAMRLIDLNELVRDAVGANRSFAATKDLTLKLVTAPAPVQVAADPRRLEQVMANLISNAVKFSDPGGQIGIAVALSDYGTRVTVADSGPGIPPEFQPRIFQKFARRDIEDGRNQSGTGLGLSISKGLIEAHSGRIGFRSDPGDTRFWFDLPLAQSAISGRNAKER